jgi:hypothetical protein
MQLLRFLEKCTFTPSPMFSLFLGTFFIWANRFRSPLIRDGLGQFESFSPKRESCLSVGAEGLPQKTLEGLHYEAWWVLWFLDDG